MGGPLKAARIDEEFANDFARAWIAAWNRHDLDAVLEHYRDDFEFTSPVIVRVVGEQSGRLGGKASVRAYWEKALAGRPDLYFELHDVLVGIDAVTLYYQGPRGMGAETFFFGDDGKVIKALACYRDPV